MTDEARSRVEQAAPVGAPERGNGATAPGTPRASRVKPWFTATHVAVTAVAGLVSVVVSLVFQLMPWLKPDPRDNVGADVAVIALEPKATVGSWIERGFPPEDRDELRQKNKGQLGFRGEMIFVRVAVDGHKHKNVRLRYRLYLTETHKPVHERLGYSDYDDMRIEAPSQRSVRLMFVPNLRPERDMFVRVELSDESGLLAVADSGNISRGLLRHR